MEGLQHFIIEVKDPYRDLVEIGNMKLFVDKKMSRDRSVNRIGKIVSCPILQEHFGLEKGYEIIFDATILYKQIYKEGVQESIHLVDRDKNHFKIESDMIVLYRENEKAEWKGFKENLMVAFIYEVPKIETSLITVQNKKIVEGKAKVKYRNKALEEMGVENGTEIYIKPGSGIPFFFKDETLYWITTKHVLAV
jgi:hypothetical protein